MTKHLPECPILKPCCDDEEFPEHGFCGIFVGRCLLCMAECICDALRACEARVREDERSNIDREMAFAHKVGYDRGRADIRDEGRNTG